MVIMFRSTSRPLHLLTVVALAAMLAACGSTDVQETPTTEPDVVVEPESTDSRSDDEPSDPVIDFNDREDDVSDKDDTPDTSLDNSGDHGCPEDQEPSDTAPEQGSGTDMAEPTPGSCEQTGPDQDAGDAAGLALAPRCR